MLLVVVLAADIVRIVFLPPERDPVLLLHAHTVLALPVSSQGFQAIARHRGQILKPLGTVEHRQLPMHNRPQLPRHPARGLAVSLFPYVRGRGVRERLDHWLTIYGYRVSVKPEKALCMSNGTMLKDSAIRQ